ncbi:MAG: winged helix-turn-helix domain-containing protein [Acidobacteriota bacterium]
MQDPIAGVVRFGSFELDLERGELRRTDGKPAVIQPRPLDALMVLVRQQGRIVSRETLQDQLWGSTSIDEIDIKTLDRSLNHCIRKLRQTLQDNARAPVYIQTLQGRGYRFIASLDGSIDPLPKSKREDHAVAAERVEGPVTLSIGHFRDLATDGTGLTISEGVAEELLAELVPLRHRGVSVVDTPNRPEGYDEGGGFRLRGSVRRSDAQVRVHAHLVRAVDDTIVGTTRFDLPLGAVFDLQHRIARRIVEALVQPLVEVAEPVEAAS